LVLDPRNAGCVLSTNARFYVSVSSSADRTCDAPSQTTTFVTVQSPQFTDQPTVYTATKSTSSGQIGIVLESSEYVGWCCLIKARIYVN
jgi:hypothetical protein